LRISRYNFRLIGKQTAKARIRQALNDKRENDLAGKETQDHGSLFHFIVNSEMPESERSEERLAKEAQVLLGGGTASTARTIGFASYYILSRPKLHAALSDEVSGTMKDWPRHAPTWADLERLPLLQAIIKESLR
jgi:cytochrome P450